MKELCTCSKENVNQVMYKIKRNTSKLEVPCEDCVSIGVVLPKCEKCQGVGTRFLTFWEVSKVPVNITFMFKYPDGKDKTYWVDETMGFSAESKILHYTKEEAQAECDLRNEEVFRLLHTLKRNNVI